MTHKKITFGELERLLTKWGFVPATPQGGHLLFKQPEFDIIVVLPHYSGTDFVQPTHLASIRRHMIERGMLDAEQFEALFTSRDSARP